jgi:hypothetical protein
LSRLCIKKFASVQQTSTVVKKTLIRAKKFYQICPELLLVLTPRAKNIKLFMAVINYVPYKARVLVIVSHFHPSLTFEDNGGAREPLLKVKDQYS